MRNSQPLEIIRGTTKVLNITVDDESGSAYILGSGETLRFAVKRKPEDTQPEVSKDIGTLEYDSENQCYVLTLNPADTESLKLGRHHFDVGLQSGADYFNVIPCSPFDVLPNVSRRDDNA